MADPSAYAESEDKGAEGSGRVSVTGTPRWVKVFAVIALAVVLLIGGLMLFGGGSHGPGRHFGGDSSGEDAGRGAPPASAPDESGGHTGPPPGIEH